QRVDAIPFQVSAAASFCRYPECQDTAFTGLQVVNAALHEACEQPDVVPPVYRMIRYRDSELRCLSREHRIDSGEAHFQAHQVTLALVHGDKAQACEQECQEEREV